jgi:hypothetical protein
MKKDRPVAKGEPKRDSGANPSHPVGTGVGAVAGGLAAGAAVGTAAGPIGTAVGAAVGAVAGGLAGKGIADMINPAMEEAYWRENWETRSYIDGGFTYDQDYGPAYRYGWDVFPSYYGRSWDEMEPELAAGWDTARGESRLSWDRAKHAARDSWQRLSDKIERAMPGDSDRDMK